jgi:hypothetical protein
MSKYTYSFHEGDYRGAEILIESDSFTEQLVQIGHTFRFHTSAEPSPTYVVAGIHHELQLRKVDGKDIITGHHIKVSLNPE